MSQRYTHFSEPVLIVDDEELIRSMLEMGLQDMGLKTLVADSGETALEILKANPGICLVLSDFRMGGMSGIELCGHLKKTRADLPFILISGFVDKQVALAGLQQGLSGVLEKPFQPADLEAAVRSHIDARISAIETDARELDEIRSLFVEEATGLLEDLEKNILRLEEEPIDTAVVNLLFRNVHSVKCGASAVPGGNWLSKLAHSLESCLSKTKDGKLRPDSTGIELFLFTSDLCQKLLALMKTRQEPDPEIQKAIELCIQSLEALNAGKTSAGAREVASIQPGSAKAAVTGAGSSETDGVWVGNDKMDSFMKLSGELIVLKNYFQVLNQEGELRGLSSRVTAKVTDFSYSLNKITDTLQDQIMSIRKVTLERALSKLPRIFRQVQQELGRKAKLTTEGFDLGVDRTIANALSSCMTHMVRNALDHGIESPEDRRAQGKPEEGSLTLSAWEQKGTIYLVISDDGRGISRERVISKAFEKGLIDEARKSQLTEAEAFDLIFLPGFSTAEKVTGISGRGVGMDVVKSEIMALKGKIRIESKPGQGSCFHLEIPVPKTVMVEQTVLVKSRETLIAVPLNAIAQLTSYASLRASQVGSQRTCQFQGKTVPMQTYPELSRVLCANSGSGKPASSSGADFNPAGSVVILQHQNNYIGLLVDSIHDQLEAVIRPFDKVTSHFPGFKGTTVLGDDRIAYVIAPEEFVTLGLGIQKGVAA
jgi:two-component system chemotaxis sensor kinase CheA